MREFAEGLRRAPLFTGLVGFSVLIASPALPAETPEEAPPSPWVRGTTGAEVVGEGFAMSSGQKLSFPHDGQTATFDLDGNVVRVSRPGKSIQGRVLTSNDKNLV